MEKFRDLLTELNIEGSETLEFDYKKKHYKLKLHFSTGRVCFSNKKQFKDLPEVFQKTFDGTEMSEYCAKPQQMKDAFRKRKAENVEITYETK